MRTVNEKIEKPFLLVIDASDGSTWVRHFKTMDDALSTMEKDYSGQAAYIAVRLAKSVTYTLADNSVLFAGSGAAITLSADDLAYDGEEPF